MNIFKWLKGSMVRLRNAGVDSPRRDCLVLIEDILEKNRAWVLTNHEFKLSSEQVGKLEKQLNRRISREPLAYIRGKAWFYGRFFEVNQHVLIPRPESESFIDTLRELTPKKIVEVGTGSGCIAMTAKLELPNAEVIATDIEKNALEVAKNNAEKHNVQIKFLEGSLLDPFMAYNLNEFTLLANLPYVPEGLITSPEIEYEPEKALFSGKDGLDHYREFWSQVNKLPGHPKYVLTESMESQHKEMRRLAKHAGYKLAKTENLIQLFSKNS